MLTDAFRITRVRSLRALREFLSRLLVDSGIDALFRSHSYNAAVRAKVERRIREVFWQGIPGYAGIALLLLVAGWWLLGIASARYGMEDAAPEVAHYALGLAVGQMSALWFTVVRCAPMAFLDYSERRHSGEWEALASLHIDGRRYVCVPWLIAAPVAAVGFWCLYYALYLFVEQAYPAVADWMGISFVPIHSGAFASLSSLIAATLRTAAAGFAIAWIALTLAAQDHSTSAIAALARRSSKKTFRVSVLAIVGAAVVEAVLYGILKH